MSCSEYVCQSIGIIHSEHSTPESTPVQPAYAKGCVGVVEVSEEFAEGLRDLDGFSHIYLIYHFDRADTPRLILKPFLQDVERGLFSTRAPARPSGIGISIVELLGRDGNKLHVDRLDVLDRTPLLDIKPYTAKFDCIPNTRNGWQDEVDEQTAQLRGKRGYVAT
ncbi:tRNA (N6-threonylcarbamoyladenosine(37)-N6)-methyltransferase TrmO [bacterium]|nr:tRNA (N6-threonylcarbamoyladenosine(37)-N6)-methyltransferase TrmO [bacterium]